MAWGLGDLDERLSVKWALAITNWCGIEHGERLCTFVATMTAESQRYPGAWHENLKLDEDGVPVDPPVVLSIDRGPMQLNSIYQTERFVDKYDDIELMFEPLPNIEYSVDLSNKGRNMSYWAAYKSGAYERYYAEIRGVWKEDVWRGRVPRVGTRFAY